MSSFLLHSLALLSQFHVGSVGIQLAYLHAATIRFAYRPSIFFTFWHFVVVAVVVVMCQPSMQYYFHVKQRFTKIMIFTAIEEYVTIFAVTE